MEEIPDENQTVIATGCEHASTARTPFDAIDTRGVTTKFKKSLSWLAYIENPNQRTILGEGGQKMRVMR